MDERCFDIWIYLYTQKWKEKRNNARKREKNFIPAHFPPKTIRYDERKDFKCLTLYTRTGRHSCFIFQVQKYGGLTFLEQEVEKEAQVWSWPRPERKMALEWLASRDEYRVHTLRTGLLGRTRNGVLKENGKVGRVREDPFYLAGGCGSVDRSFVHACTAHATPLVHACLRGTRHSHVTSDRNVSIRTESSRCAGFQFLSKAWRCFVITRFGLCARSLFAPLDSNYTLLTRLTDGRPLYADWNVLHRCAKASRYCQFPLSRISRANLLAFHRWRYWFLKGTWKPVNKGAFMTFFFIRYYYLKTETFSFRQGKYIEKGIYIDRFKRGSPLNLLLNVLRVWFHRKKE